MSEIETFFELVMARLGYDGWTLRWRKDGYCWRQRKIIDICIMQSLYECKQLLLHEIAHIYVVEPHGCQHTRRFWDHLEGLTQIFLGGGLSQLQQEMRNFYCE